MPFAQNVPQAEVVLDRPRVLAYTLGAMRRVREKLGHELEGSIQLNEMGQVVWAMLDEDGRNELSSDQVEDLIHPGNISAITATVVALITGSTPESKGAEGKAIPVPAKVRRKASR